MSDRETRLRERIDTLTDERDQARRDCDDALADLRRMEANIRAAKATAARIGGDPGAHAWLAEYDRRKAERRAKRAAAA